jgi:hypothetical protein
MAEHVEVFISGTTRELGSYRREIKEALLTLKIFPIEESNFELAYGPLILYRRATRRLEKTGSYRSGRGESQEAEEGAPIRLEGISAGQISGR